MISAKPSANLSSTLYYRVCLFVLFFIAASASFSGYYQKWHFAEADMPGDDNWAGIVQMLDGTAHRPSIYRQLLPATANYLDRVAPPSTKISLQEWQASEDDKFLYAISQSPTANNPRYFFRYLVVYAGTFLFALLAVYAMYLVCIALEIPSPGAVFAPVILILLLPYIMTQGGFFYDYPELAFFALAVWASLRLRWAWLIPIVILGTWNKETFLLFLPTLFPFLRRNSSQRAASLRTLALAAVSLAVMIPIRLHFTHNLASESGSWLQGQENFFFYPRTLLFATEETYGIRILSACTLLPIALIVWTAIRGWKHLPPIIQQHARIAAAINIPLYIAFCNPGEMRNFSMLYITFLILIAVSLNRQLRSTNTQSTAEYNPVHEQLGHTQGHEMRFAITRFLVCTSLFLFSAEAQSQTTTASHATAPAIHHGSWKVVDDENFEAPTPFFNAGSPPWVPDTFQNTDEFSDGGPHFQRLGVVPPAAFRIEAPFSRNGWLTVASYSRSNLTKFSDLFQIVPDPANPQNHVLKISSPQSTDGTIVRPTSALPSQYRVCLKVGFASFGDGKPGAKNLNGYPGPESDAPWLNGDATLENGFYWLTILDSTPRPHNNIWIHHHRKVTIDSDNNKDAWTNIWEGKSWVADGQHPIMMFGINKDGPDDDADGLPFLSWSNGALQPAGDIRAVDAYKDNTWYSACIERNPNAFVLTTSGDFKWGGQQTYIATIPVGPIFQAADGIPDFFMFGDPHNNYYSGSVYYDDIKLETWQP